MNDYWQGNEGARDDSWESGTGKLIINLQIRNTIRSQAITVLNTATLIPSATLSKRRSILIENESQNVVYIGASGVTVASGFPIYPRGVLRIDVSDDIDIYGIASGNSEIRILEGA